MCRLIRSYRYIDLFCILAPPGSTYKAFPRRTGRRAGKHFDVIIIIIVKLKSGFIFIVIYIVSISIRLYYLLFPPDPVLG
jgi:hypothetical protein